MRGIRGAATVEENSREEISKAAQLLVTQILSLNEILLENVGAIIFTSTNDLTASFPTAGLRQLPGFNLVPLFDAQETFVEGSMPMCVRVLVLADVDKKPAEIHHVYLGGAKKLRPDLT
ncbi:MAG: chorismate mutase [Selenomonadaceae bacterium]|nr:chorismate mutase [Selenomonadaceae bacterium]